MTPFAEAAGFSQRRPQLHTIDNHHVLLGLRHAVSKGACPRPPFPLTCLFLLASQLLGHVIRVRQELDRERQERNSFQLECNRIQSYWEITRQELEEKKTELRNRDREMEEAEERHQLEIKVGLKGSRGALGSSEDERKRNWAGCNPEMSYQHPSSRCLLLSPSPSLWPVLRCTSRR